jgi:predicted ATPase
MSVAQAMVFAGWVRLCRREPDACREHAEAAIDYCTKHALPFWFPNGIQLRGWALVELGKREEGLAEWRRGVELWSAARGSLGRTAYDALFAEAVARAGHLAEARTLLERCKGVVAATGERYHEAEIHRIDAELMLAEAGGADAAPRETHAKADALLERSLDCAHRQGARSFELRAATSRARLARSGAAGTEARAVLADLVASFTEGRDIADLQDARVAAHGGSLPL